MIGFGRLVRVMVEGRLKKESDERLEVQMKEIKQQRQSLAS
jgi:hypothetical protein